MCAAVLAVAGCGADGGVRVEGSAPPSTPPKGPVYVVAYPGDPLRRPSRLALDEFNSVTGIRWESWGGESAVGTGELSGMWCLPGCQTTPYRGTITLSGLTWHERAGYYGRFTVSADGLPPGKARELTDRRLSVPEP
ncbi:hypothetical protein GCM10017600_23930 [Streptosporangium carneum]|uniref:Uncharacterized protein n=2 Tax=Streptosporangium carneum TaxID=47481 RepID=A0A9W6HZ18_9ACTN|nr:hypothetical protein GCM10017600_23930 [Streptosporangium carneum]